MSLKLKVLGLGLLATLAMSAVAVVNASAKSGGHFFTTGNTQAEVKGTVETLHLLNHGLEGEVGCTEQSYTANTAAETTTSITVTPAVNGCTTTGTATNVPVDFNGCTYTFTVAEGTTDNTEQTAHLVCPTGKKVEVTHPNCTVSIHPQSVPGGLTYTTKVDANGIHDLSLHVNVQFNTTRHGLCQFIVPTNGTGTLKGTLTVEAYWLGQKVHLTAT